MHDWQERFACTTRSFLDLDSSSFARVILVTANAPEVLRDELQRPAWRRERVALGAATDPYQPVEGRTRLTRRCLTLVAEGRTPVTIVTKGTLIVRDIDGLQGLREAAEVTVCLRIATLDRASGVASNPVRRRQRSACALSGRWSMPGSTLGCCSRRPCPARPPPTMASPR